MLFHDEQQYCCSRCEPRDTNARVREKGEAGTRGREREEGDLPKSEGISGRGMCARPGQSEVAISVEHRGPPV